MNEFKKILSEVSKHLENVDYNGDLSDIGNEIGIAIGNYIEDGKIGYEKDDFINGIKHGISLTDGTH